MLSTLIIIIFLEQQIIILRLISEGSCDTEDWSNDADYSDFILKCSKLENFTVLLYY